MVRVIQALRARGRCSSSPTRSHSPRGRTAPASSAAGGSSAGATRGGDRELQVAALPRCDGETCGTETISTMASLYQAFRQIGEDPGLILTADTAHVVAYGHRVLSQQSIPGVEIEAHADEAGVRSGDGGRGPRHPSRCTCASGSSSASGCRTSTWSCAWRAMPGELLVPLPVHVPGHGPPRHGRPHRALPGARLAYNEVHYHGLSGGIEVVPKATSRWGSGRTTGRISA
jgi:hypothetical protein